MSEYDSKADTLEHIQHIRDALGWVIGEFIHKGEIHDRTKLWPEEKDAFDRATPRLKKLTFGTPEYQESLDDIQPALDHHYAHHRHHPQFFLQNEVWHPIDDFPGYEISSFGNVRSIDRIVIRGGGEHKQKGKVLSQSITPKGYCRVQLQTDKSYKNFFVHRLVASTFLDNSDDKPEVNHIDGNKKNNKLSNLEWVTQSENMIHSYEESLRQPTLKYVVHCEELDITTFGCEKMAEQLKKLGYEKIRPSGIWRSINHGGQHLDLTFTGSVFEQWMNSPLIHMNLMDVLEMIVDWHASVKRHEDGDIMRSIEVNQKRFGYSDELKQLFINTAQWLRDKEAGK